MNFGFAFYLILCAAWCISLGLLSVCIVAVYIAIYDRIAEHYSSKSLP